MTEFRIANRMSRLGTESAFEVLAHARALEAQGRDIVHLEIGEPDFATPQNVIDAAVLAMNNGATHYTPASGAMAAREATARYVTRVTGASGITAENVVLVPGSKNILHFALLTLINAGDEVIIPDPGYPIYRSLVDFVGGIPVSIPIRERNDFRLDVDELASLVTDRTRLLIVNSPANPTGGVLTSDDCAAIADLAVRRNLIVLSDEIYARVAYEGMPTSLFGTPGMAERTILMDGISKTWAMCGWRLGYGVMPVELASRMDTLMINTSACVATFTQAAAIEAFESAESDAAVERMVQAFRVRRDLLVDGLNRLPGVRCHRPVGAFYVFPNISDTGWNERALADALLDEVGVACLAGTTFGPEGRGHLRFSYANDVPNIERALDRIGALLSVARPVAGVIDDHDRARRGSDHG